MGQSAESGISDPTVSAVSGAVRGRNGISFQSHTPWISPDGQTFEPRGPAATPPVDAVPKLVGTNMAIRRSALVAVGGFDDRFRFFLEDSDLSLRLVAAGHKIVHDPSAQVHHAFAASPRRDHLRMPRRSDDIGRSASIFLKTHLATQSESVALAAFRQSEHHRLIRHMISGNCEPRDVDRILASFDAGVAHAQTAPTRQAAKLPDPPEFQPLHKKGAAPEHVILAARSRDRRKLHAQARAAAAAGRWSRPICSAHRRCFTMCDSHRRVIGCKPEASLVDQTGISLCFLPSICAKESNLKQFVHNL